MWTNTEFSLTGSYKHKYVCELNKLERSVTNNFRYISLQVIQNYLQYTNRRKLFSNLFIFLN